MQQTLAPVKYGEDFFSQTDYINQLIEDGMPARKKEKKKDGELMMETTAGGAEIFIPKKRNKKVKYPKGFDPKNPGSDPDPERWLPKWQRSKYKRLAKKRGLYLKGAQGDSQVDTDVTKMSGTSTAH